MNSVRSVPVFVVTLLLMVAGLPFIASAGEAAEGSVYQLSVPLETHRGEVVPFSSLQGDPLIVSMFYGSCPHVCPLLISTVQQIEGQLAPEARAKLRVVMVSVDPARDTPEHLHDVAERHGVDEDRWMLARTLPDRTRLLAAVLGVRYKAQPNGIFNHTSTIILYDAQGREVARTGKLGVPDAEFVSKLRVLVN